MLFTQGIILHILLIITITVNQDQWVLLIFNAYYFNDILWGGEGCTGGSSCCDDTTQPWFHRQLDHTIQDNIEVRICALDQFGLRSTLIDQLELYIQ